MFSRACFPVLDIIGLCLCLLLISDKFTLGARGFFSLGATELSGEVESRSGEKKTSGTNG